MPPSPTSHASAAPTSSPRTNSEKQTGLRTEASPRSAGQRKRRLKLLTCPAPAVSLSSPPAFRRGRGRRGCAGASRRTPMSEDLREYVADDGEGQAPGWGREGQSARNGARQPQPTDGVNPA